jgi:acetyltransferase-like isoleucine patch superfamily enzyme
MFLKTIVRALIVRPRNKILTKYYTWRVSLQAKELRGKLVVNGKSSVSPDTVLGHNVHFNGMRIDGGNGVFIGDNFHSGFDCLIIGAYHNYDSGTKIPYDESYILKTIVIEDNVWLGSKVIIMGGVTIGEGAVIQAGSVVVSDIPKYGIAGGSPAKVFKTRDIAHYENLKAQGKFH